MFGFGKKKSEDNPTAGMDMSAVRILTIPPIFYGGNDPEVYHTKKIAEISAVVDTNQKLSKKVSKSRPRSSSQPPKTIFSHRWTWIAGGIIVLILIIGVSWYYLAPYFAAKNTPVTPPDVTQQPTTQNQTTSPTTTITIVTTTPDITTTTSTTSTEPVLVSLSSEFITFPPLLTLDTSDIDSDDLTDIEEELFNTDSGTWDTDVDGYYDGQEVSNLYNPRGFSPVRLIDSGLIREYTEPNVGYRLYYPQNWQRGSVDTQNKQVLFSALSGDYIEVRISEKTAQTKDFISWFGRHAEGERFTDIREFTNRFSVKGWVRKDSLVAYFEDSQYVYVFLYHPVDIGPIAYRQVMQMMYQSFRPRVGGGELPDQTPRIVTTTPDVETPSSTITSSTP